MAALSPRSTNILPKPKADVAKKQSAKDLAASKSAPSKNHAPPPPGFVYEPGHAGEKYITGNFLGRGGFAVCYEGKLSRNGRLFAMKVVKSEMPQRKMAEKFRTELQIHSKMRHPNIVTFYRAFAFETNTYVILEMCPNGSVMEMVKKRRCLSLPEVRRFMIQLCGAVKYLHKRNVAHRDLKMGNLFLDRNMNIKVGDFGLAAIILSEKDEKRRKTLCGTPNYIAPEVLDKNKGGHTQKVDIWSLGVIFFAMLTGFPPFQSKTQEEIYKKVRNLTYAWPKDSECLNYIPAEAKGLVSLCLSLDEDERPEPDQIVDHEFFTMYPGCIPGELDSECRYSKPNWIKAQDPRGDRCEIGYSLEYESRYLSRIPHIKDPEDRFTICKNFFYTECGVGRKPTGEIRRPVGKRCSKSAFAECAAEEELGMQPIIPLPLDQVYCYIPEDEDWSVQELRPEIESRFSPVEEEDQARKPSSKVEAATLARTQMALAAQLRRKESQPRSHAAQLRQQALPPRQPTRENPLQHTQTGHHRLKHELPLEAAPAPTTVVQNLLSERPIRCKAPGYHGSLRERTRSSETLSKSASTPSGLMIGRTRAQSRQHLAALAEEKARPDPKPSISFPQGVGSSQGLSESLRIQSVREESQDATDIAPRKPQPKLSHPSGGSLPERRSRSKGHDATRSTSSSGGSRSRSAFGLRPLIRPDEDAEIMPGTSIREVMGDLKAYFSDLCRSRSYSTATLTRTRRRQQKFVPTKPHSYVMKWVDYTNRYGIGYVLDDGSVGCVFKSDNGSPASCVVVRDGERHIRLRTRAKESPDGQVKYSEVDQLVPRGGRPVEFYENIDVDPRGRQGGGVKRVLVDAKGFDTNKHSPCELTIKIRTLDTEKVKRVKLVDQFGKYMIGSLGKDVDDQSPTDTKPGEDASTGQYVRFYQRLGNVGIWGFGDGAFQFNFPDHTKLVLSLPVRRTGNSSDSSTCCQIDFFHLAPSAARYLKAKGKMHPSGFDTRAVITDTANNYFSSLYDEREIASASGKYKFQEILEANSFRQKMDFIIEVLESWITNGRLGGRILSRSASSSSISSSQTSMSRTLSMTSTYPTSLSAGNLDMSCNSSDMFWLGPQEKSWVAPAGGKFVWVTVGAQGGDNKYMSLSLKNDGEIESADIEEVAELKARLKTLTL
ncbi:polo-like serine threonine protein kinase, putative [Coccidioides posadasii C735 delta SOWgp]|uniref:Polo-like serine threonine protein kinase, putative n=1 Tax=Coccidioides posadasii (strain C735) TaxID=222929 RepID=C5P423_COCP7|nr:polo-like serine threonine protein kinase, putative [Coccidioides posadasii C735 delta SOWgp]EER28441.1 polo-like serine threonine protein kinase, putative [Coccidioides posadasii C735 delta SOWgp]|eukprot:XP_003070586.1 polo-like serine threonine protein kinase, putative [Coccidioides posadasii C735 delta SOWgp]